MQSVRGVGGGAGLLMIKALRVGTTGAFLTISYLPQVLMNARTPRKITVIPMQHVPILKLEPTHVNATSMKAMWGPTMAVTATK